MMLADHAQVAITENRSFPPRELFHKGHVTDGIGPYEVRRRQGLVTAV